MIELTGKYNTAKIFTDNVDDVTIGQVIELCNQEFAKDSQIRIMPDTHAGKGCVIGTTMTIQDKVVPNLVGVDIGCGMHVSVIKHGDKINFEQLDEVIRKFVPHGQNVHDTNKRHASANKFPFDAFRAPISISRGQDSLGTLGGGNHFIEVNEIDHETSALVIHSGSRSVGAQIAKFYQNKAYDELTNNRAEIERVIEKLKSEGRAQDIQRTLADMKKPHVNKEMAYLEGESFKNYMHDMNFAQKYAEMNRLAMSDIILRHMGWTPTDSFDTIHNYIDMQSMILRKGAISAQKDERVIVPINMRDGSLIALGKGNPDWNYSGPHGAGRVYSRTKAKENIKLEDFEASMKDVWTTSVGQSTLDEAPMAYKSLDAILDNVTEALDVLQVIKPLYNFKSH